MSKAKKVLFNNTEQAEKMLLHMWSTMEMAEIAIDETEGGDYEHKYSLHVMALLKEATQSVRALLDENMQVILGMDKEAQTV